MDIILNDLLLITPEILLTFSAITLLMLGSFSKKKLCKDRNIFFSFNSLFSVFLRNFNALGC